MLNTNPLNFTASHVNENAGELVNKVQAEGVRAFLHNAYEIKYPLTTEQFDILAKMFHPQQISYCSKDGGKKTLLKHPHAIPAMLNGYAYEDCTRIASNGHAIDIGGNPRRTAKGHHICALVNDARTDARYTSVAFDCGRFKNSLINDRGFDRYLDKNQRRGIMCDSGAVNCCYQSDYAYMINVYDIPIESLPEIFEKHGLLVLDIWMFLPYNIIDDKRTVDQTYYKNEILQEPGKAKYCRFSLCDNANTYVHDYSNWRRYAITTKLNCRNFSLVFEHVEQIGTFTKIRVIKSTLVEGKITRMLQMPEYKELMEVPDVVYYLEHGKCTKDPFIKSWFVDKDMVSKIISYGEKQTETQFNYPNFAAHMDGVKTNIYYESNGASRLVYRGLTINADDYCAFKMSCFLITAVQRYHRTQDLSDLMAILRNNAPVWYAIPKHNLRKVYHTFIDKVFGSLNTNKDPTYIYNFKVREPLAYCASGYMNIDYETNVTHVSYKTYKWQSYAQPDYERDEEDQLNHPNLHVTKATTTKVVTFSDADDKAVDRVVDNHYKIVYNPPADGKCGAHAVKHALNDSGLAMNVPVSVDFGEYQHTVAKDWWEIDDIRAVVNYSGANAIVHTTQLGKDVIQHFTINPNYPTCRFALINMHWYVVDCSCKTGSDYVGKYVNLPVDNKHLYINCANSNCSDGAGQALDFAKLFPNYARQIQLPVKDVAFTQYKGAHLCIAVAHNLNQEDDKVKSLAVYRKIFGEIEKYCKVHNLTAYMPLLGTKIFGNPVCCFKRILSEFDIPLIMCFLNDEQSQQYSNTNCSHGGYREVAVGNDLQLMRSGYDDTTYSMLKPKHSITHMLDKLSDFMQHHNDMCSKPGEIDVIELSGAPGKFKECARNTGYTYFAYHYTKGLQWKHGKPDAAYDNLEELLVIIRGLPKRKYHFLLDLFLDDQTGKQWYNIMHEILHVRRCMFTFKYELYNKVSMSNLLSSFGNMCSRLYFNDWSYPVSSEMYVCMYSVDVPMVAQGVDLDLIAMERDVEQLEYQTINDGVKCTCDYKYECNATYSWRHDGLQYKDMLNDLCNDDLVLPKFKQLGYDVNKIKSIEGKTTSIEVRSGIGGSRKSTTALKQGCSRCTLIIAPYKLVSQSHNDCVSGISVTYITALLELYKRGKELKHVFLDEIFAYNPYIINVYKHFLSDDCEVVGLGDPKQIINRDYGFNAPEINLAYHKGKSYDTVTYRVPRPVLDLIQYMVPEGKLTTKSRANKEVASKPADDILKVMEGYILTHTQDMKNYISGKLCKGSRAKIMTVNESAGRTLDYVNLYVPDIDKIMGDKQRFVFTAATRTSTQLVLYGSESQIEQYFTIEGTPMERALLAHDITPHAAVQVTSKPVKVENQPKEPIRSIDTTKIDLSAVTEILDQVFVPANTTTSNVLDYKLGIINENLDVKRFKVSTNITDAKDVEVTAKRHGMFNYNRIYHGKDNLKATQTLLARYAKKTKHTPSGMVDRFSAGFEKFLRKDWRTHIKNNKITSEEIWFHTCDYIMALQEKFNNGVNEVADHMSMRLAKFLALDKKLQDVTMRERIRLIFDDVLYTQDVTARRTSKEYEQQMSDLEIRMEELETDLIKLELQTARHESLSKPGDTLVAKKCDELEREWTDAKNRLISFHMKAQPKEIRGANYDTKDKAGQGISAWSKMMNVVFSGMTRAAAEKFKDLVAPNVIIAYGVSDEDIGKEFMKFNDVIFNNANKSVAADITEFDSSQEAKGIYSSALLLRSYGFNQKVIDGYLSMRNSWSLYMSGKTVNESFYCILGGVFKQHSGQPFTLDGNTIFNMGLIGACYDLGHIFFASFKGDDSFLTCQHVKENKIDSQTVTSACGFKVKMETQKTLEYIANIVTPFGFYPDVIRRVSRVVSKLYHCDQDWDEVKLSIADCLAVIQDDRQAMCGAEYAAMYYGERGIRVSADQVKLLAGFLKRCTFDPDYAPKVHGKWVLRTLDVHKYLTHPFYSSAGYRAVVADVL